MTMGLLALRTYWQSEEALKNYVRSHQQRFQEELNLFSKQGFQHLAQEADSLEESINQLSSDSAGVSQTLLKSLNASLLSAPESLEAGVPAPTDPASLRWVSLLLGAGGEYQRWFCKTHCELQLFSQVQVGEDKRVLILRLDSSPVLEHFARLKQTIASWQFASQALSSSGQPTGALPPPPDFIQVKATSQPVALWQTSLSNEGNPAWIRFEMPLEPAIEELDLNWRQTTSSILITLLITFGFILALLWMPLRRLNHLTKVLPNLSDKPQLDDIKSASPKSYLVRDESHLLAANTFKLYNKLQEQYECIEQQTDELKRLAQYDPLTGLYNRSMLEQALHHCVSQIGRNLGSLALLFLDLNKFKPINDELGHEQGDLLLQQIAHRLASCVRKADLLARFGGDEFVILLPNMGEWQQVHQLAQKLFSRVSEPIELSEKSVSVGISIGVTFCLDPEQSPSQLLKEADAAMYQAKYAGDNQIRLYHRHHQNSENWQAHIESALHQAMSSNELELVATPLKQLSSSQWRGYQVDLIWHHPQQGELAAKQFIHLLSYNQNELLEQICQWLLDEIFELLQLTARLEAPPSFFIPASVYDFQHPSLLRLLGQRCEQKKAECQRLVLELEEAAFVEHCTNTQAELSSLHLLGVPLCLTRFGNGFGSLNYLRELPLAWVRLDQSFHQQEHLKKGVTQSLIAMMHKLDIQVIVDEIEQPEQLKAFQQAGADFAQGDLLATPVSIPELKKQFKPN